METTTLEAKPIDSPAANAKPIPALFFTIDSESTADIDDAISIERVAEGFRIRVAIANASAHVKIGSPEDADARRVAASTYAATRVVHRMLPKRISERAGSLVQGRERKAAVLEILLNDSLDVLRFTPSAQIVRVDYRLSYDEIPRILEDAQNALNAPLALAAGVARALLESRRNNGALAVYDLRMMLLTDEDGIVRQMRSTAETIGNIIVQEMMILANTLCAKYAIEHNLPYVYRNHEAKLAAPPAHEVALDIGKWMVGSMPQRETIRSRLDMVAGKAKYEEVCRGHYALNLPAYGHFTSPLRRYPDLLNQRQLLAYLEGVDLPYTKEALTELTKGVNEAIEHYRVQRREGFKNSVEKAGMDAVEKGRLSVIPDHELCAVIKLYGRGDAEFPPELGDEMVRRCQAKEMTDKVLVCVLFEIDSKKVPVPARDAILAWIGDQPGKPVSMCVIGKVMAVFKDYQVKETEKRGFECRLTATFDGNTHKAFGRGAKKKDAEHSAARNLLAIKMGVEVGHEVAVETGGEKEDGPSATATPAPTMSNPKGALLDLCVKRKLMPPTYSITRSGSSHAPRFSCTAVLEVESTPLTVKVENCLLKKHAEALASEQLLTLLQGAPGATAPTPRSKANEMLKKARDSANPIGALQEIAQKLAVHMPEYSVADVPNATPWFACQLVTHHAGIKQYSGEGANKQQAKMAAAKAALADC